MKQAIYILILTIFTGCFFDNETFNRIPCAYDFTTFHDSLKQFGLQSYSQSPQGYKWRKKYDYDSTLVDCDTWNLSVGIDSCHDKFYDENYVVKLAALIFDEPKNSSIQYVSLEIDQCHYGDGHRKFHYEISRKDMTYKGFGKICPAPFSRIMNKLSESYEYGKPEKKMISLLLDSLPEDPYLIAYEYAKLNKKIVQVGLLIEHIDSRICKRIEYLYGFEN